MKNVYAITGASGLLGQVLCAYFSAQGHTVYALHHTRPVINKSPHIHEILCDLRDQEITTRVLDGIAFDTLIHTAGLTSVDQCEIDPDTAFTMNTDIPERLAQWCAENGRRYIFISSDHVTSGKIPLFSEYDDIFPLNIYAKTKMQAEKKVLAACPTSLVLRTNFFGRGSSWRKSLTDWLWDKAIVSETIPAFTDSYFSPISSRHLARIISDLSMKSEYGIFHAGGAERLSKYDFAIQFMDFFNFDRSLVQKSLIADAKLSAPRPSDMSMSVKKIELALGWKMPKIQQSFESIKQDYI